MGYRNHTHGETAGASWLPSTVETCDVCLMTTLAYRVADDLCVVCAECDADERELHDIWTSNDEVAL